MEIHRTKNFKKQYIKLPEKIRDQFSIRLELFVKDETNELLRVHKLIGSYDGYESMSVTGDYRALFYRNGNTIVIFAFIGTHSRLYK